MELFGFDNVKAEKAKAIFQYNLLKTIQTLFRVTELFLLIILVCWTSFHLPLAFKISCEYFRLLISIIINPFSIFLIGNIIVLCLLFKSRITIKVDKDYEIYQEYFTGNNPFNVGDEVPVPVTGTEEVLYEDKETIYEEDKSTRISLVAADITSNDEAKLGLVGTDIIRNDEGKVRVLPEDSNVEVSNPGQNDIVKKNLTRSKSDSLKRGVNISKKLRRSETEKCRGILKEEDGEVHVFDELSNEEFQNAIETFIAKQLKFHEAEEHAIVLHSQV